MQKRFERKKDEKRSGAEALTADGGTERTFLD